MEAKQGRNEKCRCGSGKKYKVCCLKKTTSVKPLLVSCDCIGFPGVAVAMTHAEILDTLSDGASDFSLETLKEIEDVTQGFDGISLVQVKKAADECIKAGNNKVWEWFREVARVNILKKYVLNNKKIRCHGPTNMSVKTGDSGPFTLPPDGSYTFNHGQRTGDELYYVSDV